MSNYNFFHGLPSFRKALDDILKKFDLTEEELRIEVRSELTTNPNKGTPISNHPNFRKLRVKIPSHKGKRGGLRFIMLMNQRKRLSLYISTSKEKRKT